MKCNEACKLLTMLASDEIITNVVSDVFLKARDILVCKDNGILDVLADDKQREVCSRELEASIKCMRYSPVFSDKVVCGLANLQMALTAGFEEECDGFLPMRCKSCPRYKGE